MSPNRREFLAVAAASVCAGQAVPIPTTGDAPQLFVDLDRVEALENVERLFHAAEKHPANPVIRKVHPWEVARGTWGSVIYDDQERVFKAWYGGTSGRDVSGCAGPNCRSNSVLCHAISQDGIVWERPKFRMHEAAGTRDNNVVIGDGYRDGMAHWESVRKDPLEPDPARQYKGLGWSSYDWNGPQSGIFTMTSPDGLRWTHSPDPVFRYHPRPGTNDLGPVGDAQSLMIDTLRRRYVAHMRRIPHRVMSESTDFNSWTAPRTCLEAEDGEMGNMVYNHAGFVYGDRYLGFLTWFNRNKKDTRLTVQLLTSRDGDRWLRAKSSVPLIGSGAIGEVDRFTNMLTGAPPIRVGGKLYVYYRALANRHGPYEGADTTLEGGGICLATLRADGFASLGAGYEGGSVLTRPFRFTGTRLRLNAKADFGRVLAEVLDADRRPVPGFEAAKCEAVREDGLELPVRWQGGTLGALREKVVRLRFQLFNARLYSYMIGT